MSIKFRCSECQHGIKAPDEAVGKAIKCPQCGKKLKVPGGAAGATAKSPAKTRAAGKSRKAADEEAPDSDAFLNNLDIDRLVDTEVQLCKKCATEIPEGETACPNCGFDPEQLTVAGRKRQKMASQGIDPLTFYDKAFKEPFAFTMAHFGKVIRSGMILSFFMLLAGLCAYFLIWVATVPPFAFYLLVTTVCVMIPFGWLLHQHVEVIKLTLQKKDEIKKMPFDFALCGMNGMKFFAWLLVYGLPFWIVFGGLGALLNMLEVPFGMLIGLSFALLGILMFTPQAMSHFAMPVEQPAWFFPKIVPSLGVSLVPGLVWAGLFLTVNLPVLATIGLVAYMGGESFQEFVDVRVRQGTIRTANVMLKLAEGASSEAEKARLIDKYTETAKLEAPATNWSAIAWPLTGGVLCFFMLAFSSLVVARANGLFTMYLKKGLHLIGQSKEVVWEGKKDSGEKHRTKKTTIAAPPVKRVLANFIDVLLIKSVIALLTFVLYQIAVIIAETAGFDQASQTFQIALYSVIGVLALVVAAAFFISQESGDEQATPGQKAMKLYVCNNDFAPISGAQGAIRFFAWLLLSVILTLFIGSFMAFFRQDRKTLHDLLSGTQVRMDKPPAK